MSESFDEQLGETIRRIRSNDLARTPSFDDVLAKRVATASARSRGFNLSVVACLILIFSTGALWIWTVNFEPKTDANAAASQTETMASQVNFDAIMSAIDARFADNETLWTTPTDSLMAINLEDSIDDSFLQ